MITIVDYVCNLVSLFCERYGPFTVDISWRYVCCITLIHILVPWTTSFIWQFSSVGVFNLCTTILFLDQTMILNAVLFILDPFNKQLKHMTHLCARLFD